MNILFYKEMYKEKKVCLLGCGKSIEKYNIDFSSYDIVVGINRIYQTSFIDKINILYNGFGDGDRHNARFMLDLLKTKNNFISLILLRNEEDYNLIKLIEETKFLDHKSFSYLPGLLNIKYVRRPLTGIVALNHILKCDVGLVDIFGFDFYVNGYIEGLKEAHPKKITAQWHDLSKNKNFLKNLIKIYPEKIIWNI